MTPLDRIKQQLRTAGIGRMALWSSGPELIALVEALSADEPIEAAVRGQFGNTAGYAVATPIRVVFAGGTAFARRNESFAYDKVSSITAGTNVLTVYASGNEATLRDIRDPRAAGAFAAFVRQHIP